MAAHAEFLLGYKSVSGKIAAVWRVARNAESLRIWLVLNRVGRLLMTRETHLAGRRNQPDGRKTCVPLDYMASQAPHRHRRVNVLPFLQGCVTLQAG